MPTNAGWVKYDGNPVLGGELGTCFDIAVLEDGENGKSRYRMYFSWRPKKAIALVESEDGIRWSAPVIVLGPRPTPEGWEDDLNRPAVLKKGDQYHMWYTGQFKPGQADGKSWLFYAVSRDGIRWERVSSAPVLAAAEPWEKVAVMCPHVIWDEPAGLYKMWYSGGEQYEPNAIGYATSPDGIVWTKYPGNPIFFADPNNSWEQHKAAGCQVIYQDGWYVMLYIGYRDEHYAQIGMARSRDGITAWERFGGNPIIAPDEGAWDGEACYKPYALCNGKEWLLWYNGRKGAMEQIGLATHPGAAFGFE